MSTTRDQVNYGYISQNCVAAPSPPDATGTKSEFAWQLAEREQSVHHGCMGWVEWGARDAPPQLQFMVVDGLQYAALAK